MAIATTIDLLQAVNRAVQGVKRAPELARYPTAIDAVDCPYVISWPAEGQFFTKGGETKRQDRIYRVICYIEPLGLNDIPTRAVEATALLQRFIDAYIDRANVALADPQGAQPTYQVTIESGPEHVHTDSGLVSNLLFGKNTFHGFELRINVRELWVDT